jgi:hypothetical protein
MDVIIDFRQFPFGGPAEEFLFRFFKALEFLDQQQLETGAYPHAKMKRDVLMGISSAIPPGFGSNSDSAGFLYPLFDGQHKIVASRLISNCTEFGIIKTGIIQGFPFPYVRNGAFKAELFYNDVFFHLAMGYISKRDIVIVRHGDDRDFGFFNGDFDHDEILYHKNSDLASIPAWVFIKNGFAPQAQVFSSSPMSIIFWTRGNDGSIALRPAFFLSYDRIVSPSFLSSGFSNLLSGS